MAIVHIVLATYNGEKYLSEQLESLLNQTFQNFEIEICDDGSTDKTIEIAENYCKKDSRINLYCNTHNKGYIKNFIEGIKRSKSDYIMLCDQDDIWNEDKIEKTLREMKKEEHEKMSVPILVFTNAMNYNSELKKETGKFHENSRLNAKKVDTAHLFMENKCIGCTIMINQAVLPYLEKIPEEGIRVHDWWLALICSSFGKIVYLPETTLRYRQHSGNAIGGETYRSYIKKRLAAVQKQKEALLLTYRQGALFYDCFQHQLSQHNQQIALQFAKMESYGFWKRRYTILMYHFWKSGLIRNLGLLILA